MKMSRQHFDFIADNVGPIAGWPSQLHDLADKLASSNPRFDRDRFFNRAVKAWETHQKTFMREIDDEIIY